MKWNPEISTEVESLGIMFTSFARFADLGSDCFFSGAVSECL